EVGLRTLEEFGLQVRLPQPSCFQKLVELKPACCPLFRGSTVARVNIVQRVKGANGRTNVPLGRPKGQNSLAYRGRERLRVGAPPSMQDCLCVTPKPIRRRSLRSIADARRYSVGPATTASIGAA